jgi:hypothetical protein
MAVFVFPPISLSSGPVQFNLNGVATVVSKDTVTPANSKALPVELTGASGPINITAGDLNVQLSDQGANPDVTRIGDGTNQLAITVGNAAKVDGSAVTQPISAASLPLPSGAATEAKQDSEITKLTSIDGKIPANLTVTSTRLLVDGSGVTQPVSVASLPLPSGAATETTLSALNTKVPANLTVTSTRLLVDGSGVTQPVSGTVGVSSLPSIPAGTNIIGTIKVTDTTNTRILGLTATGEVLSRIRDSLGNELLLTSNQEAKVKDVGLPAALGQLTKAASTSVTLASDQGSLSVTPGALTASFQEVLNLTTVAQTVTPPASAKWVKIYADNTNSNNIRVRLAGTATTTSGISMEPGRTEDFQVVGTAISIIAEAGTNQKINFTFGA